MEASAVDVFEQYLAAPPLPNENDPIRYWAHQRSAAEGTNKADGVALAQMALDYLSAPGTFHPPQLSYSHILTMIFFATATSIDLEQLFSFSGGTISKLRNQLSDKSARATVLLGQWVHDPMLVAREDLALDFPAP